MLHEINFLSVIMAALANMALGAIWYAPPVFGKAWLELVDAKPRRVKKTESHTWAYYLIGLFSSLTMAFVLAFMLSVSEADLVTGFIIAFLLWVGFIGTISLNAVLWGGRDSKLWLLDNAFYLVSLVTMSIIIFYLG